MMMARRTVQMDSRNDREGTESPVLFIKKGVLVAVLSGLLGCQGDSSPIVPSSASSVAPVPIPREVQRIAVLYPTSVSSEMADAYNRLEEATFGLKAVRPSLKFVDRLYLPVVLEEHRFQLTGSVADESAVRLGRVLGVDTVLIYRINGPSMRDRMWARSHRDLPPVTVTSKMIRVESAEVLYHNIVEAEIEESASWGGSLLERAEYQRLSREAMERGIVQTVSELRQALK
jgi:hypothetical protein